MDLWIPAHRAEDGAAAPLTMGYLRALIFPTTTRSPTPSRFVTTIIAR